jgi:TPR repeat protein
MKRTIDGVGSAPKRIQTKSPPDQPPEDLDELEIPENTPVHLEAVKTEESETYYEGLRERLKNEEDPETITNLLKQLLPTRDIDVVCELAWRIKQGLGTEANPQEALKMFNQAMEDFPDCGHPLYGLGNMYETGTGVPMDKEEAVRLFRMGAEKGYKFAQTHLAKALQEGDGVPRDLVEACKWFEAASEQGCEVAMHELAWNIYEGMDRTVPRDLPGALKWWRRGSEAGDRDSQYSLGFMLLDEGTPEDIPEGVKWLTAAAESRDGPSRIRLGRMLMEGDRVAQDIQKGVEYWHRAAEENEDISAMANLGRLYRLGLQTKEGGRVMRDPELALKYYMMARSQLGLSKLLRTRIEQEPSVS